MKKRLAMVAMSAVLALGLFGIAGCAGGNTSSDSGSSSTSAPSGDVSVYSREEGSGTRGAFIELFGIEEKQGDKKVDMTTMSASIANATSVIMTSVAGDPNGIGYISLGSLNDNVKALKVDGAAATAEGVKSGEYKIARPFNIVTKDDLSDVSQDFIDFIMSADGQKVVESAGYISAENAPKAYSVSGKSGKVVVAGSSSVTPVMEKLAEAYKALNKDVAIEVQQSDSTTGVNMTVEGTCDIGMVSREVKDTEAAKGVKPTVIAQDGIAVIVNKAATIDSITSDQVKAIYTGEATTWEQALA